MPRPKAEALISDSRDWSGARSTRSSDCLSLCDRAAESQPGPERRRRAVLRLLVPLGIEDRQHVELEAAAGHAEQARERGLRVAAFAAQHFLDVGPVLGRKAHAQ